MRLRNSFWAGLTGSVEGNTQQAAIEAIRLAMLRELGDDTSDAHLQLDMEITFASDIESLWELRVKLRSTLSKRLGDEVAHDRLQRISEMFIGFHPSAKKSRFFGR